MNILKFGGSSVKDETNIRKVLEILLNREDDFAVVFSAMGGVTDSLLSISKKASQRDDSFIDDFKSLKKRHFSTAQGLLQVANYEEVKVALERTHKNLKRILEGVAILGEISPRTSDYIVSFGERTSARIIAAALSQHKKQASFLDARKVLVTDSNYGNARLKKDISYKKIRAHFKNTEGVKVITGFIASDENGKTTTLGRGGSDYTAAIFAEALKAKSIEIWTDVDGILSADPRKVEKAFTIPQVSYQEAMELSHFGAKVIYPPTIKPALDRKIPVYIKNTFNPTFPGTVIKDKSWSHDKPIIGISAVNDIVLMSLEGSGLIGVPGIAARLFGSLAIEKINIIMITQCSSEHAISFAIKPVDSENAKRIVDETFASEIDRGYIKPLKEEKDLSIVAAIGENMKSTPGISAKLFQSMGVNGINIVAIAQGSSELNISVVLRQKDQEKALNVLHEAFFEDDSKDIHLYIVGVGLIGKTLLQQINEQRKILSDSHGINLNISGIANSKKMVFSEVHQSSDEWLDQLNESKKKMDVDRFVDNMIDENRRNAIFIDNTASKDIMKVYERVLDHSISISTPNKLGASASMKEFLKLKSISNKRGVKFGFETNVGAGLPVLSTLEDLIKSGDTIEKIEAVLSGSLSFIFNSFTGEEPFSEIVKQAKEKGFTEPDPRDDLNGYDVRRKILILVREAGYKLEEKDIKMNYFLSKEARNANSVSEFMKVLQGEDKELSDFVKGLSAQNKRPRMIAEFSKGKASVGVQEVDESSPFYSLEGSDNMIVFTTKRYHERPLVIRGPGAGAEVTAAGVLAEILRIANSI